MSDAPENPVLSEAIACAGRGWPVFPCKPRSKVPATKHGFKDATTDAAKLRRWWSNGHQRNLAIATGAVSGLIVLDVDHRHGGDDSLDALERKHGRLPATVEALTGGGGRHLLFRHPGGIVRCRNGALGPGLDVKADGGYIVAPPSIHPSGSSYAWELSSDPEEVELAAAPDWLLKLIAEPPADTEDADDTERTECPRHTGNPRHHRPCSIKIESVEQAIQMTLPTAAGQRNRRLFDFARALKAMPEYESSRLKELRPIVERWHVSSVSVMSGDHDFADTWADFVHGWTRVRHPLGIDPIQRVAERARAAPMPESAPSYESEPVRLLVRLCRELHRESRRAHFYLTYRAAGDVIGIDKDRAGKYLAMLCVDGVIERLYLGRTGRASEYRYILSD